MKRKRKPGPKAKWRPPTKAEREAERRAEDARAVIRGTMTWAEAEKRKETDR